MTIKQAVEKELRRRKWSRYKLAKKLEGRINERTLYAWLADQRDLSSSRASIILEALGLKIKRGRR